jgi:microcystin-dependent protein
MSTLNTPHTISNGISADGANLEANFSAIETFCNTEVLQRDGTVAATQPIAGVTPVSASHFTTKGYVDGWLPVGAVQMYAGASEPTGWLLCRGQAVSRTTYAALFAVIGTAYGAGDGSTTFNVPNFQGTIPVGFNTTTNPPSGTTTEFSTGLGERAGTYDNAVVAHTHTMANHTHVAAGSTGGQSADHYHAANGGSNEYLMGHFGSGVTLDVEGGAEQEYSKQASTNWTSNDHTHSFSVSTGGPSNNTTDSTGSSGDNQNIQPSLSINFMIRTGL